MSPFGSKLSEKKHFARTHLRRNSKVLEENGSAFRNYSYDRLSLYILQAHINVEHCVKTSAYLDQNSGRRSILRKPTPYSKVKKYFYLIRNLWNGLKYFGAKYSRTKDLTGKELSVSFTDIRPGVFLGGPKNWAKSMRFRPKRFLMGRLRSKQPIIITVKPLESCEVNKQFGVEDFKYAVTFDPKRGVA